MKKIKLLFALSIAITTLAGCNDKETTPADWNFDELSGDSYTYIDSELLQTEEENVKIIRINQAELLDNVIDDDDFFVFDYDTISKIQNSSKYFLYDEYKQTSVKTVKKVLNESNYTMDIYFEGNDETIYGVVFNKDASYNGDFVFTIAEENALSNANEINIDKFENDLLASPNPTADESGYIDIVSNFGKLIKKVPKEGENIWIIDDAMLLAVLGILLTIGNWIWSALTKDDFTNFTYFNHINNRLNQIDKKLTDISNKLTASFSAILDQLDSLAIQNYTDGIGNFKNDFLLQIDNISRFLSDELAYLLKDLVTNTGSVQIELGYDKTNEEKYVARSLISRVTGQPEFKVTGSIPLEEAKKYLQEHSIADEKFAECLNKDIMTRINNGGLSYPADKLTKEGLASDIFGNICETLLTNAFKNRDKYYDRLSNYRNLFINYCKQFYTTNIEIVNKYVNRCKLSYNFGAEAQKSLRNNLAALMFQLDKNAALAQMLCRMSNGNVLELDLTSAYINARNCIKSAYESVKNIASNYCFRDGKIWEAKLFSFSDSVAGGYYPSKVRTSFSHSLETKLIKPYKDSRFGTKVDYDRNANPWANSITLRRMSARFEAQKMTGALDNISPLSYFHTIPGLVNPDANRMLYPYAVEYGPKNIHRFIGDFSTRAATELDKGKPLQVSAKGDDPWNPYFGYRENTAYLQGPPRTSAEHWKNGTFYTCDMIDADTGEFKAQQDFIMYADYVQDKSGWRHYESYAFSGTWSYYNPWSRQTYISTDFFGLGVEVK